MGDLLIYEDNEKFLKSFENFCSNHDDCEIIKFLDNPETINNICTNDLIYNNIEYFSKKLDYRLILKILSVISKYDKDYAEKEVYRFVDAYGMNYYFCQLIFPVIIKLNFDLDYLLSKLDANNVKLNYNDLLIVLNRTGNYNLVKKYIDYLTRNNRKLIEFKSFLHDSKSIKFVNNVIDNNIELIIEEMVSRRLNLSLSDLKKEKLLDFFKILLEELTKAEDVSYHDIELKGEGSLSAAYLIGNKIIKIGDERITFNIDNNKRFLKPLYRQNINTLDGKFMLCLEITEQVDMNNISDEDLYTIYKSLSDDGYFWLDAYKDNIGRLIRDNEIYYKDIDKVSIEATGYLNENEETLKKGELVLVDNDYIYKRNSKGKIPQVPYNLNENDVIVLEERYQAEKKGKR